MRPAALRKRELTMALQREVAIRRSLAPRGTRQWSTSSWHSGRLPRGTVVDFLVAKGFTPAYGAHPQQHAISRYVLLPLAREIAARSDVAGTPLTLQVRDGQVVAAAAEPAGTVVEPQPHVDGAQMLGLAG